MSVRFLANKFLRKQSLPQHAVEQHVEWCAPKPMPYSMFFRALERPSIAPLPCWLASFCCDLSFRSRKEIDIFLP